MAAVICTTIRWENGKQKIGVTYSHGVVNLAKILDDNPEVKKEIVSLLNAAMLRKYPKLISVSMDIIVHAVVESENQGGPLIG